MHDAAREFVAQFATEAKVDVVEIGSRDINGTVRDLFPNATYCGIDRTAGKGVDRVADAVTWTPSRKQDLVICCEVFEHAEDWPEIVGNAVTWLRKGGKLVVTAAGPRREPHSAVDGGVLRDGEYYRNIDADELADVLEAAGLVDVVTETAGADVRGVGVNNG